MKLFDSTFHTLESSLDYSTAKNRVISNNLANADTPHFKTKQVVFKDILNDAIRTSISTKTTHEKHISFQKNQPGSFRVVTNDHSIYNHNGNNVDVEKEMAELAKNQLYYQGLVDRMNGKFQTLRMVIKGGN